MTITDLDGRLARTAEQLRQSATIPLLVRPRGTPVVDARYVRVRLPGEDEPVALSQEELAALLVLAGRGEVVLGLAVHSGACWADRSCRASLIGATDRLCGDWRRASRLRSESFRAKFLLSIRGLGMHNRSSPLLRW